MLKMLTVLGLLAAAPTVALAHDNGFHRGYYGRRPEVYVARRPVWVPGYWSHRGPHRVWTNGAWIAPPQPGYAWVAPQRVWDRGRHMWVWQEGYWAAPTGYAPAPAYPPPGVYVNPASY
jgi:hypothetical protein